MEASRWLWPSSCCSPSPFERRAAGRRAEQEAAPALVAERPDLVADALEAEHRVEDEERDHVEAVGRVGGAGGGERAIEPASVIPSSRIWPSFTSL